jgi:hypothetical protein
MTKIKKSTKKSSKTEEIKNPSPEKPNDELPYQTLNEEQDFTEEDDKRFSSTLDQTNKLDFAETNISQLQNQSEIQLKKKKKIDISNLPEDFSLINKENQLDQKMVIQRPSYKLEKALISEIDIPDRNFFIPIGYDTVSQKLNIANKPNEHI